MNDAAVVLFMVLFSAAGAPIDNGGHTQPQQTTATVIVPKASHEPSDAPTMLSQPADSLDLPGDVLFEPGSAEISGPARPELARAASLIRQSAAALVEIEGHTDSRGTEAANLILSQRRAEAVRDWLVRSEGLSQAKFSVFGRGELSPIAPNKRSDGRDDLEGQARNRRVKIIFHETMPGREFSRTN